MTHQGEWDDRAMPAAREASYGRPVTIQTPTTTVNRLAAGFHRCFSDFDAGNDVFADDAFFDLLPPMWRFQLRGPGAMFADQLRSIAAGPVEVEVVRTIPTDVGFVTEHVETQHTPHGDVTARRLHLCEVADARIQSVTTYCNGGWDDELRARHAADAPMIRS
jgi:hypothetical protein